MMKLINHGILFGALALGLVACSDEAPWGEGAQGEGGINLRLSTSADVSDAAPMLRSAETLVAPAVESFGIRLEKEDGSYFKEWGSLDEFNAESFRVGTYKLTAFNGDINEEGFDKPCFIGSTEVTVLEARQTDVEVTATLANTMVSINYTDAFKSYFSGYSGTLHSEGHSYVAYTADHEGTPVYLYPGMVDISVQVTDNSGRTVTVQPAKFDAQPRHHYHVTIDVKGGQGNGALDQLVISFDDSVNQESVTIDLTEELFTTKAPEVAPTGFENGEVIEHLQGVGAPKNVRFDVIAMGGIESATLTVNSNTYTPSFGKEFDLMSADASAQAILASAGISAKGLWHNPDRMAFVDLTEYCKSLPAGRHEITLVVKDKFTRVSNPVTIVFDTNAVNINVVPNASVYGSNQAVMAVDYNGTDVSSAFSFQAEDDWGQWQNCNIVSAEMLASGRALPVNTYNVTVTLPQSNRKEIPIRVFYRGKQFAEVVVPVVAPEFEAAYDAFAHSILVKVSPKEADKLDIVATRVRVFIDGNEVAEDRLSRDRSNGIITVNGFNADSEHKIVASLFSPEESDCITVRTETEVQVPNGDFEQLTVTYDNVTMNQGGEYTRMAVLAGNMQNHQSFTISEPTGWSSSNPTTCSLTANPQNSWFVCPSVFNTSLSWLGKVDTQGGMGGQQDTPEAYKYAPKNGSNAMVIRNVGWSNSGTVPSVHKKTATPSGYYNEHAPSSFNHSAGTLFLGANGAEGADFNTRPAKLKGFYRYMRDSQDGFEKGVVKVSVRSGNTVIATGTASLDAAADFTEFSVPLTYNNAANFGKKATSLRIRLTSSDRTEPVVTTYAELHRQEATGAVLVVDNLTFEY